MSHSIIAFIKMIKDSAKSIKIVDLGWHMHCIYPSIWVILLVLIKQN